MNIEDKTLWIVRLSSGEEIHSEEMSWQSLAQYLKEKSLRITEMQLRFRDHSVRMPSNARGYYFTKACGASMGVGSFEFFVAGVLNDENMVERIWFYVPELEVHQKDVKSPDKVCKEGLIINKE